MLPSGEGIGIETQKNAWRRSITVQNGLIPIAYRRDIRHGRILLGAFFLLGQVALVGPIAKRICTNEGFRSIHKLCIHILFLSLSHPFEKSIILSKLLLSYVSNLVKETCFSKKS